MVNKVAKLLMLLSPISYLAGMDLEKFDLMFFQLGVGSLFIASVFDSQKIVSCRSAYLLRSLAYLLILAGINVLINSFNVIILANFVNLVLGFLAVSIIVRYVDKTVLRWVWIAVLINIIIFALQKSGWSPIISIPFPGKEGGIMGNAPRLVDYLTIVLPLMPWPLMILAGIVALLAKELVFFVVLAAVIALRYGKWGKIVALGACGAVVLLLWPNIAHSIELRWVVWKPTLEILLKKPLIGYGLGIFPHISKNFVFPNGYFVEYTFNSYLNLIFGLGILALYPVWKFIRYFYHNFNLSGIQLSILSILMLSFFEYPFEVPKLWITLAVLIGLYIKQEVVDES